MAEERSIKERVLVVVVDARVRARLASILEREGFRCTLAADVDEARTRLERAPYDLILCNVRLPDGSGPDLIEEAARRDQTDPGGLTPREREVLQLAANGSSAPEIADVLVVSLGTVKTHFQNIYAKLGAGDRAFAVAKGLRRGLID